MASYYTYEKQFPDYVIIKSEGYFYSAHGRSAELISILTGYKLGIYDKRPITGSPVTYNMTGALLSVNASYIVVEDDKIIERNDGIPMSSFNGLTKITEIAKYDKQLQIEKALSEAASRLSFAEEGENLLKKMIFDGDILDHITYGQCSVISVKDHRIKYKKSDKEVVADLYICIFNKLVSSDKIDLECLLTYKDALLKINDLRREYKKLLDGYKKIAAE